MSISAVERFYHSIYADGRAQLAGSDLPSATDVDSAVDWLLREETSSRMSMARCPPVPDREAVHWGALAFYRATQFAAFRDLGAELIRHDLHASCPVAPSPGTCYGVDLALRFLPDLVRLTRSLSNADPLLGVLLRWGRDWPLSSVGVGGIEPGPVDGFVDNPALRMLYIDRIIRSNDVNRVCDPRVESAIAAALGAHGALAPELAAALGRRKSDR